MKDIGVFFRISFFISFLFIKTFAFLNEGNEGQLTYRSCKMKIYTMSPFKAVKIKENKKLYTFDYDVLVFSYCSEVKDYLKMNVNNFLPVKINRKEYVKEVRKIGQPFGNQGISVVATLDLDSISIGECSFLKAKSNKGPFEILSEGTCWVGINAPNVHEGFTLRVKKSDHQYIIFINRIAVSPQE